MATDKIEILSPAGSFDALAAAVTHGAHAVYLGAGDFNARRNADNFTPDKLRQAVAFCHARGVRVYLTLNTLIKDTEMDSLLDTACTAVNSGIDAFIAADLGVIVLLQKNFPQTPVHCSTQATVHNLQGAKLAADLGCSRVILSRELDYDSIKHISKYCDIETEIFAHGALCTCYSGKCLLSSILGGRSGNRGTCAQPCRLFYCLEQNGKQHCKGFLLSPKDLCLAEHIDKLLDCGATSLKIEGRMKGPGYTAATAYVYRTLLQENRNATPQEIQILADAFSRGTFTTGFFNHDNQLLNIDYDCNQVRQNDINLPDTVYGKTPITMRFTAHLNQPCKLEVCTDGFAATAEGTVCVAAQKTPITQDSIRAQLQKAGGTPFTVQLMDMDIQDGLFLSASNLNALRRDALDRLEMQITSAYEKQYPAPSIHDIASKTDHKPIRGYTARVTTNDQYMALQTLPYRLVYVPVHWVLDQTIDPNRDVLYFPDIITDQDMPYYEHCLQTAQNLGIHRIKTANFGIINLALSMGFSVFGAQGLNIFNRTTAKTLLNLGLCSVALSCELHHRAIRKLAMDLPCEMMVYGRLALMQTANCPNKAAGNPVKCHSVYYLRDRKNEVFPVLCSHKGCISTLLNSKPLYTADKMDLLDFPILYELVFTTETPQECTKISGLYLYGWGEHLTDFTRGHYFRKKGALQ